MTFSCILLRHIGANDVKIDVTVYVIVGARTLVRSRRKLEISSSHVIV